MSTHRAFVVAMFFIIVAAVFTSQLRPPQIATILNKIDALISEVNHKGIMHRDFKLDNLVYKMGQQSRVAIIDFGQSLDVNEPSTKHNLNSFWTAHKFVSSSPTYDTQAVLACYDKITLEMNLLMRYGIHHSFAVNKTCRNEVNSQYVTKHFIDLLKANGYDANKFIGTERKEIEIDVTRLDERGYVTVPLK